MGRFYRTFGCLKGSMREGAKNFLIFLIRAYRGMFSGIFGGNCRFIPSCSEYGIEAIRRYGPIKGLYKTVLRIFRCNPFSKGGYDRP